MKDLDTATKISDYVAGIATRVTAQALREKIICTMAVLAGTDGVMHPFEKNLLGLFAVSFNVTSDRLAAIKAAAAAATARPAGA